MKQEPTNARKGFGDIAPHLAELTDKVLFGDVWENSALSPRDRSLVTITSLISLYRINEMPFHLKKALENGVTRDEIIGAITPYGQKIETAQRRQRSNVCWSWAGVAQQACRGRLSRDDGGRKQFWVRRSAQ
jgi:4-carboxymuconolactone decarboxylase